MSGFIVVWLGAAAVIAIAGYAVRSLRMGRWARLRQFYWRGLIILALVGGLGCAYAWDIASKREVAVPEGVGVAPPLANTN